MSKRMPRYPTDRKVYVGDLGNNARKNDLEYAFGAYGQLRNVWIARNPPGFAFVEFEDPRDAADAVRGLDGRTVCGRRARVELSTGRLAGGGRRGDRGGGDRSRSGRNEGEKCYECGGRGHYARNCRHGGRGGRRRSTSRSRSRSPYRGGVSAGGHSRSRSASASRVSRKLRDSIPRSRENGRGENGDASRYSEDEHNGSGGGIHVASPPVHKRRYEDSSPSPKRRMRSLSHRRGGDSSISRSRSSSRRD